jgi:hypothetical protein
MHFVYGFCSGYGRAAVVEYWQFLIDTCLEGACLVFYKVDDTVRLFELSNYRVGETRNAYTILVGKRRHSWEDNVKIDLREIVWERGLYSSGLG